VVRRRGVPVHVLLGEVHDHHRRAVTLLFFFQAEDGIRDATVTGVQTCALPISFRWPSSTRRSTGTVPSSPCRGRSRWRFPSRERSEERRVGQERPCRAWRWHANEERFPPTWRYVLHPNITLSTMTDRLHVSGSV